MLRIPRSIAGPALAAGIALLMASAGAQSARGEAMKDYARAKVQGYEESTTNSGPRSASANGSYSRDFVMSYPGWPGHTYNATRTNVASAKVSDDPSRWLEVASSNNGPRVSEAIPSVVSSPGSSGSAGTASWNDDRLQIAPGTGGSSQGIPQFLRLNFRVLGGLDGIAALGGQLMVKVNELTGNIDYATGGGRPVDGSSYYHLDPGETPLAFDDISPIVPGQPRVFSFHYDLPIGADGLSDPLTVSLMARAREQSGGRSVSIDHEGYWGGVPLSALALDSIALPDGSTPESRGYSLKFESGLRSPNPVPEPASVVIWGVVGVAAFGLARRRRGRSGG